MVKSFIVEDLREDWFANCVKPSLNKDITYLLTNYLNVYVYRSK